MPKILSEKNKSKCEESENEKKYRKKVLSGLLSPILMLSVMGAALPLTGCSESASEPEENQLLYVGKASLPAGDFQIDVSFPDCAGTSTLSALPANSGEKIGFVDVVLGLMKITNADIYITGSNSGVFSSFTRLNCANEDFLSNLHS